MSAKIAVLSATVAALVLASGTAAAPPVPVPGRITAGTGCSVHCIVKALVTPTASYANVAIETSVPTKIQVIAFRAAGPGRRCNVPFVDSRYAALGVPARPEAGHAVPDLRQGN